MNFFKQLFCKHTPKDGIYLIKKDAVYELHPRVKMLIGKSVNLKTGEVHYSTHADRIRNMSIEELADYFSGLSCWPNASRESCKGLANCRDCWLDWLRQEVTE